jgi:hypothetical protein
MTGLPAESWHSLRLDAAGVLSADRVANPSVSGSGRFGGARDGLASGTAAAFVIDTLRPRQVEGIVTHSGARVLLASDELLACHPDPACGRNAGSGIVAAQASLAPQSRIKLDRPTALGNEERSS